MTCRQNRLCSAANRFTLGSDLTNYPYEGGLSHGDAGRKPYLEPLVWQLALRGQRRELLPEIAGPAVYRIAPGLDIESLPARGALMAAVRRLALEPVSLRELAGWPGLDRDRASRLLNGLYLLAGLIVSRAHPAAGGERRPSSTSR